MKKFIVLISTIATLVGCGDETSCGVDDDCFQGEICTDGSCVEGMREDTPDNVTRNNENSTNNTSNNANGLDQDECLVSIGNRCEDDEFEPNDEWNREAMATDQEAWCDAGELVTPEQSWSGTLCAGDGADHFRMQIDNRPPGACLSPSFTIRITVEFEQACDPGNVRVVPYTFFDKPSLEDICEERETVRCEVSDEGKTHVIDWIMQSEQLVDPRLMISTDRDDVQLDYDVSMEVIQ